MKIEAAIKEFLVEAGIRKYTQKTIRGYRINLNLFLRFCNEEIHIGKVDEITLATLVNLQIFSFKKVEKGVT